MPIVRSHPVFVRPDTRDSAQLVCFAIDRLKLVTWTLQVNGVVKFFVRPLGALSGVVNMCGFTVLPYVFSLQKNIF